MSDLTSDAVQESSDVTNLGPPTPLEGVSGSVGSCLDSAKTNTDLLQPLSTNSPDLEHVKSEQDASKSGKGIAAMACSVSKGVLGCHFSARRRTVYELSRSIACSFKLQ